MNWFGNVIEKVKGRSATTWTFVDNIPDPDLGLAGKPIDPDNCYIEIFVESLRLKQARRFATSFHGVVYSFVRLAQDGMEDAELAAISKPDKLANLDPTNLDRVITVSNRITGALPWRGGTLGLEIGLFSVKQGNLISPVLDYVTRVSEAGGISFIGQVKPFLPLITAGMDLIAGQTEDAVIEVALDTDMHLTESRLCAIVAVPADSFDRTKLSLDPADRTLLLDGKPLQEAYCVFSIRRTDQKADFGAIPDIRTAWEALRTEIKGNDKKRAEAALADFTRTVIVNPDLIAPDAERLIQKAETQLKNAFRGAAPVNKGGKGSDIGSLDGIRLYSSV